jgi:GNAT superfamily N-acetyltransferase
VVIKYRVGTLSDIVAMAECRLDDPVAGPADHRMAAYLRGEHHPQEALAPRTAFVAVDGSRVVGYIAGHLTHRYKCEAELQYLFVALQYRRAGVAAELLARLAGWFTEQRVHKVCVNVEPQNAPARAFYEKYGAQELRPYWYVWTDVQGLLRGAA